MITTPTAYHMRVWVRSLQLGDVISQLTRNYSRQSRDIADITTLYRREALQRKLLYNEVSGGGHCHMSGHVMWLLLL